MATRIPNATANSREEAIRLGLDLWILPRAEKRKTAYDLAEELRALKADIAERERKVEAIKAGYMDPPDHGQMFYVTPKCERGCTDCAFACIMAQDFIVGLKKAVAPLEDKLRKLERQGASGRTNVVELAAFRSAK